MTVERIIELLENEKECVLRNAGGECNRYCAGCDLLQDDTELHEMYTDAIALLKAQEPRVLTLEEALEADICWAEAKGNSRIIPARLYYGKGGLMPCSGSVTVRKLIADPEELPTEVYGADWRCWSARPTNGQRKAAAWNDD